MNNPATATPTPDHRRTIYKVALVDLRAHGNDWLSGVRDQTAVAAALADVEQMLVLASDGLTLKEVRALRRNGPDSGGNHGTRGALMDPKVVLLTQDDIIELRDLAEQTRKQSRDMLAMLRDNKDQLLARAADREKTEQWIETATAHLVESEAFDTRQLARYEQLLEGSLPQ